MNVALDTMANLIEGIGKILPNCLRTNSGILHCSETDRDRSSNVQIELTNNSNGRLFIRQSFFYAGRLYGGALLLIGERWVPLVSDGFSLCFKSVTSRCISEIRTILDFLPNVQLTTQMGANYLLADNQ